MSGRADNQASENGNGDEQVRERLMAEARQQLRQLTQAGATLREIEARFGPAGLNLNRTEREIAIMAAREQLRRIDTNGVAPERGNGGG